MALAAVTQTSPSVDTVRLGGRRLYLVSAIALCLAYGPMYSALSSEHDVEDVSTKNGTRLEMLHPSR